MAALPRCATVALLATFLAFIGCYVIFAQTETSPSKDESAYTFLSYSPLVHSGQGPHCPVGLTFGCDGGGNCDNVTICEYTDQIDFSHWASWQANHCGGKQYSNITSICEAHCGHCGITLNDQAVPSNSYISNGFGIGGIDRRGEKGTLRAAQLYSINCDCDSAPHLQISMFQLVVVAMAAGKLFQ